MEANKIVFKLVLFSLLFMGWTTLATFALAINLILFFFGKRFFAKLLSVFPAAYNMTMDPIKKKLFTDLNSMKPGDGRSKLKILEIGGGAGANFKYFTTPAEIDVVEPNAFFSGYFDETRNQFKGGKLQINPLLVGVGEDLKSIGIEDNSYDAVVMTLVLCSVEDQAKCIKEVQRVLRPGGKFFYLEHIVADQGDSLRMVQQAMMIGDFWPTFFDGCCVDRDTPKMIEDLGGWTRLEQNKLDMLEPPQDFKMAKAIRFVIKPHLMGVAEK